jgi:hypothetical protein
VSFLRRILGGSEASDARPAASQAEIAADEQAHELEILRAETARLDELQQRQLRYADKAWTPPAQGGDRRADDEAEPGS